MAQGVAGSDKSSGGRPRKAVRAKALSTYVSPEVFKYLVKIQQRRRIPSLSSFVRLVLEDWTADHKERDAKRQKRIAPAQGRYRGV
jgi:hypothetical protein